MTRILYWNINNFSLTKILQLAGPMSSLAADDRLEHILGVMAPVPPDPTRSLDMIIIIEVAARNNDITMSGLILPGNTKAALALFALLEKIKQRTGEEWCMIPPPIDGTAGKREAVGIFYKPATLTFTGPWIYSKTESGASLRVPVDADSLRWIRDYPQSYRQRFPVAQRIWHSDDGDVIAENRGAAQTEFETLHFPTEYDRAPTYVRMLDQNGRTLKIFTVHTSPAVAATATRRLSMIPDVQAVGPDEVTVVLGDFNCDSFEAVAANDDPYYRLRNDRQYEMLLKARMTATGPVVYARRPYCMTHLLPNVRSTGPITFDRVARPHNGSVGVVSPTNNVYPRLGYMGSSWPNLSSKGAIDNAFIRYGANQNPVPHYATIVNTIVGQPYTAVAPPPGVTADLTSGRAQASDIFMWNPAMVPTGFPSSTAALGFNDWHAYQHIYDTSDHLALIFDV